MATAGQVNFVELQPRPHILPGQVIRLSLSAALREGQEKLKDRQVARIEAEELARWLKEHGPEKLRARSWREVAILCPRRDWLRTTAIALRKIGLPVEVQSESDLQADSPAYAWLTALCTIMVEPQNHYEIVGRSPRSLRAIGSRSRGLQRRPRRALSNRNCARRGGNCLIANRASSPRFAALFRSCRSSRRSSN